MLCDGILLRHVASILKWSERGKRCSELYKPLIWKRCGRGVVQKISKSFDVFHVIRGILDVVRPINWHCASDKLDCSSKVLKSIGIRIELRKQEDIVSIRQKLSLTVICRNPTLRLCSTCSLIIPCAGTKWHKVVHSILDIHERTQ